MKKTALLFPGQGSQYVGMAKSLCESYEEAREVFEEANEALGFNIGKLCFEGSIEELTRTENTQPSILTASVATYRVFIKEIGIEPTIAAGHSLGEISALCCAGGINFTDAVKIVRQRGKFMQEAVPVGIGSMAAISGVSEDIIEEECKKACSDGKLVAVSNYNSPDQIVISGNVEAVNEAGEILRAIGARIIPLRVSAPFHSSLMQPAADKLREELSKYNYGELKYPVIANVTAQPYPGRNSIIEYLTKQIIAPVRWKSSMEYLQSHGMDLAVELGPQMILRNLMKKNVHGLAVYSFDNELDAKELKQMVSERGNTIDEGIEVITRCIAISVCTKNNNWNDHEYQKGVVEPYRKIKNMKEDIMKEVRKPTINEVRQAMEMLLSVFKTKKTPKEEQISRFNEIFGISDLRGKLQDLDIPS